VKETARDSKKDKPSAFIEDAVQKIIRFAAQPGPIVLVTGDRSVAEVNGVLDAVHEEMPDIGTIRRLVQGTDLTRYLNHDQNPDPIFYRDVQGDPTNAVQRMLAERCADPVRRHQLPPLLLVAVKHQPSPHPKPEIPSHALHPAFAKCVGARIVNISARVEQTNKASLKNLFLVMLSRKGGPQTQPAAMALIEKAFKDEVAISDDMVIKLARACRSQASKRGLKEITRDLLLELFPARLREAAEAS
jgi:hypothetical protein